MPTTSPPRWRVWLGIALAALGLLLGGLLTSALPAALDLRPAVLVVAAAAALVLASAGSRVAGRVGRSLLLGLALLAGLVALSTARDLWLVYRTEEVRFRGGEGVELAGTLYVPRGGGRHVAIVLVHGSGREPRREYRFYARRFARAGLVALAYDKRGCGASGGDFAKAGYVEFAADALAAIRMLRSRPEVDPGRVGLWGLSEGEWVGALTAVQSKPAFLVLVSPCAMTPSMQVGYETRANVLQAGFGEGAANRAAELYARLAEFQRTGAGRAELNRQLAAAKSQPWFAAAKYLEDSVPAYDRVLALDWFPAWHARMDFDGLPLFARLQCPVLVQERRRRSQERRPGDARPAAHRLRAGRQPAVHRPPLPVGRPRRDRLAAAGPPAAAVVRRGLPARPARLGPAHGHGALRPPSGAAGASAPGAGGLAASPRPPPPSSAPRPR